VQTLRKMKKIKLSSDQMRPPDDAKLVGAMADGTPIWEGPIFAGNPLFQGEGPSYEGVKRTPVLDEDGKQKYTMNRATGVKVTPIHRATYEFVTRRYIMVDFGNGSCGPRPVPGLSPAEASEQDRKKKIAEFTQNLAEAAIDGGYKDADSFVSAVQKMMEPADASPGQEPVPRRPGRPRKTE
jgi:hypothetical protein